MPPILSAAQSLTLALLYCGLKGGRCAEDHPRVVVESGEAELSLHYRL